MKKHLIKFKTFCFLGISALMMVGVQAEAQNNPDYGFEQTIGALDGLPVADESQIPKNSMTKEPKDLPLLDVVDSSQLPPTAVPSTPPTDDLTRAVSLPEESSGSLVGTNVQGDGGIVSTHSGTYYDSSSLVPDSALVNAGANVGPRKVDPAFEPGGKFVVVEKGAKASSYEGRFVSATRALRLERYAAAMEMFEDLYKSNHKDTRVLMGLALAQQGAGFLESAKNTYEELLNVQPNNADAIVNLMGILRGQYPAVTLRKLAELRNKYPSNAGIPAQMALIHAEGGEYQEALKYYDVAASMDPSNASHIFNMAIVFDKKGDPKNAIKLYERALSMDSSKGLNTAGSLPREEIYDRLVVLRRKV